jgi:uncharacterized protein (DUF1800 family)
MRDEVPARPEPEQPDEIRTESDAVVPSSLVGLVTATLPMVALAACGDGGGAISGGTPTPTPTPPPVVVVPPTQTQASRFLSQTSMGATKVEIDKVAAQGYDAWITAQFATPRATSHWDWLVAAGYNVIGNKDNQNGFTNTVWRQAISGEDQLRQRVTSALSNFIVVGIDGIMGTSYQQFAAAAYLDVLADNAFGNFRDLIERISLNLAMGYYLTFINNKKANATTGSQPDENYARELMQLFTLGLYKLNADGTLQLSGGNPIETYGPADVSGLARVFTGFVSDGNDFLTPDRARRPMIQKASDHELGVKTFLGVTIPAGTDGFASLKIALDTIFAHQNVPPFVSKQLIQRLVTSNPSSAYVGRVSAVFVDNGSGVRGDMKAVIRAILLDTEARSDAGLTSANGGKLREPVTRLTNWARAFGVTSPSDAWAIGDTNSQTLRLGQTIGKSPSVFNFFRPGYAPPNTAISNAQLVAPEFQVTNELTVVAYINYMQTLIQVGTGDVKADYTSILTKAADSAALISEVNILLASGNLSSTTIATIKTAVDAIGTTTPTLLANRVYTAILLAMASSDYIVQK